MLEYGFSHENSPADVKAAAEQWALALNAKELAFFHQALPFVMIVAGMNSICSQTAGVIAMRTNIASPEWIDELAPLLGLPAEGRVEAFAKLLVDKFTGFRCNVAEETNSEWVKRHTRNLPKAAPAEKDDRLRFAVRASHLPVFRFGDRREARRCFDAERSARIAATPQRVEVEVCVG